MDELINKMNGFLADSYSVYLKAHFCHWNVKGPQFSMFHDFFGDLYGEVYGSVDDIAEQIKQIDGVAQNAPTAIAANTGIKELKNVVPALTMVGELLKDTKNIESSLLDLYRLAERYNQIGLSNFLQDRMMAFKKHSWMLKSFLEE